MLKHPFYQKWSEGKLSEKALAEYAKQYYADVRGIPNLRQRSSLKVQ